MVASCCVHSTLLDHVTQHGDAYASPCCAAILYADQPSRATFEPLAAARQRGAWKTTGLECASTVSERRAHGQWASAQPLHRPPDSGSCLGIRGGQGASKPPAKPSRCGDHRYIPGRPPLDTVLCHRSSPCKRDIQLLRAMPAQGLRVPHQPQHRPRGGTRGRASRWRRPAATAAPSSSGSRRTGSSSSRRRGSAAQSRAWTCPMRARSSRQGRPGRAASSPW